MQAAGRRYILHRSRSDKFRLWNLADLHWGSKACSEDAVRKDIKEIKDDPYSFWFGGGDMCDFIGYSDKRFDADCVAEWVTVGDLGDLGRVLTRQIAKLLKPIAHKGLGMIIGNHEKHYELRNEHESLHGWLCEELGVPCLEYSALVDVIFVRTATVRKPALSKIIARGTTTAAAFRCFLHHGSGYAVTPGGKLNRLTKFMKDFDADLYFIGHVHDHMAKRDVTIGADSHCKKLTQRERLGVIAGSYLKTYSQGTTTYGEQRGYSPTSMGAGIIEVCPDTRTMRSAI